MPLSSTSARRERRRRLRRLGLFVPFALLASSAPALDLYWKNPVSGFWGVGSNWTPLWFGGDFVPGPGDVAHIDSATLNAFTVTLSADVSVDALFSRAALNLAGHSLALAGASASEGSLDLSNARLLGAGALTASGTTTLHDTTLGSGGLLTLTGATSISGNSNVLDRNVVAGGTTVWNSGSDFNGAKISGSGTFTNNGTFNLNAEPFGSFYFASSFVNAGTLQGGGVATFGGASFTNSGTVVRNGLNLLIVSDTFTNTGLMSVTNGILTFNSASNDNAGGTIRVDGGTGYLNGGWATGKLGTLQTANGGQFVFGGTLDNAGATLDLDTANIARFGGDSPSSPDYGTVKGGTVAHSENLGEGSKVVFDGVSLLGGLNLRNSSATLRNGTTLGVQRIDLANSLLSLEDAGTTFDGALTGRAGTYNQIASQSLTFGANALVSTEAGASLDTNLAFYATGDLANRGAIRANPYGAISFSVLNGTFRNEGALSAQGPSNPFAALPLKVEARAFVNEGTVSLDGSSASFVGTSAFDNAAGTISLNASTLTFGGDATLAGLGSIIGTNGSRVRYGSGTVALGGGALDLSRFGNGARFGLSGGTLSNGSVVNSDLLAEDSGGTLSNVTLDKGLRLAGGYMQGSGTVDIAGDLRLLTSPYGQSSSLLSTGDVTFHGGEATLEGSSLGARTITGLSRATVSNSGAINSNEGALDLDELTLAYNGFAFAHAASTIGTLVSNGGPYSNNGVTSPGLTLGRVTVAQGVGLTLSTDGHGRVQVDGDLSVGGTIMGATFADALDVNGGTVSGTGNVARLYLHGATLAPGHSTGHLNVGDISLDAASRFDLEIGGDASTGLFDSLSNDYLYGSITLGGTLDLSLVGGYAPTSVQTWRFIEANYANRLSGTFSTLNLGTGWSYGQDATGAFVSYAPVPEPASLAAFGLGLAAVVRRRRKRRDTPGL